MRSCVWRRSQLERDRTGRRLDTDPCCLAVVVLSIWWYIQNTDIMYFRSDSSRCHSLRSHLIVYSARRASYLPLLTSFHPPLLLPAALKNCKICWYVYSCEYSKFNPCPAPGTITTSNSFAFGKFALLELGMLGKLGSPVIVQSPPQKGTSLWKKFN